MATWREKMAAVFHTKTLCLFEVELKRARLPECVAQLEVVYRLLDAPAWARQPPASHLTDQGAFRLRLQRGEQFWTAQYEQKILAYCWATHAPVEIGEVGRIISPRRDEVYLYDAFTLPEYRGRNLYPALLHRILVHSRQQGVRRALIFVLSDNSASIRGVRKAGFGEFQRLTYYRVLGFKYYVYRPRLPASAGVDLLPA